MKCSIVNPTFNTFLFIFTFAVFFVAFSIDNNTFGKYEINGNVTDATTSLPLKKIRVIRNATDYLLFSDTIYTDSVGKFSVSLTDYYAVKASFLLKVEDSDAGLNGGEFATQNVNIVFSSSDWSFVDIVGDYKGKAVKTQDIRLLKK